MQDRRMIVTVDRPNGVTYRQLEKKVEKILVALKPLNVRIRMGVAPSTLKQHLRSR